MAIIYVCKAGAVACVHKRNGQYGLVECAKGQEAKDGYGNPCPHLDTLEVV